MSYEFALDKKAAVSLIAGSIVIGVLLFFAGWIVGRQWPVVDAAASAAPAEKDERAALPTEPVLHEDASPPNSDAPKRATPKTTLPKEPTDASTQDSAAAAAAQLPAPQPVGDVRVIETATDEASAVEDEQAAAAVTEYVTVQVGVFLDEKEASRLLQQMERKGYAPTFFSGRDAEARQWYAVRIGAYSDRQQATNAAANFTKQEKIKAVVRPLESL